MKLCQCLISRSCLLILLLLYLFNEPVSSAWFANTLICSSPPEVCLLLFLSEIPTHCVTTPVSALT
jgi:hypothetical protein